MKSYCHCHCCLGTWSTQKPDSAAGCTKTASAHEGYARRRGNWSWRSRQLCPGSFGLWQWRYHIWDVWTGFWSGVGHGIIFQSTGWAKCCLAEVHGANQLWGALYVKGVFVLLAFWERSRYTENRKSSESHLVMQSLQSITCHDIRQTNISSKCSVTNRHWND